MTTAETDQTGNQDNERGHKWRDVDIVFADGSTGPAKAAYVGNGWCDVAVERNGIGVRLWVRASGEVDLFMNPCRLAKPWTMPETGAATGAASPWTTGSWNTCPKCKNPVEKAGGDVDIFDGDEMRCVACKTVFMVSFAENGGPGLLYEPERDDAPEPEDKPDPRALIGALLARGVPLSRAVADADPLAGLPEAERTRIESIAHAEAQAKYLESGGSTFAADGVYRRAIAREVAADNARVDVLRGSRFTAELAVHGSAGETLNREEAEKRLRAAGFTSHGVACALSDPRSVLGAFEDPRIDTILRGHVRWLDAPKSAAPVAAKVENDMLATVPTKERARIIAVAEKASRDNPFDCDRAYRDVVAREVAAWHARPPCVPCSGKGGLPGRWKCGVCGGTGRTIPAFDGVPGANPYGGKRPPASVRIEYDHGPDGETYRIEVPATPVPIGIARRGAPERVTDDELSAYAGQSGNISKADGPELAARLAAEVVALRAERSAHVCSATIDADTHRKYGKKAARLIAAEADVERLRAELAARPVSLTPEQLRAIVDDLTDAGDSRTVLVSAATVRALLDARPVPIADTSPDARAEGAWLAWDGALPGAELFAWDDFHPAAKAAWHAVVNYCDGSRPVAPLSDVDADNTAKRLLVEMGIRDDAHVGRIARVLHDIADGGKGHCDGSMRRAPSAAAPRTPNRGEYAEARESLRVAIDCLTTEDGDDLVERLFGDAQDVMPRDLLDHCASLLAEYRKRVSALRAAFVTWCAATTLNENQSRAWETLYRRSAEFMATYPQNYSDEEIAMRDALRAVDDARASRGETGPTLRTNMSAIASSDPCPDGKCAHPRGEHAGITGESGCGVVGCPCISEENPYFRTVHGPGADSGPLRGLTEEQAVDLRESAARIAETCSGGDHIISKRDLIAQRIRELPLRAAAHADDDESSVPAMRHVFIARQGDSPTEPVPPMCPTPESQSPDGALARTDAYARLSALGLDAYPIVQMLDNAAQYLAGECGAIREDARAVLLAYVRGLPRVSKAPPARTIPEPTSAKPKRLVHIVDHEGTVEHGVAHDPDAGTWSTPRSETVPGLCDCYASTPGLSVTARDWHAKTCPEYIRRVALSKASPIETRHDPIGLGEPFPAPIPDMFQGSPPGCPVPMPSLAPKPSDEEKQ